MNILDIFPCVLILSSAYLLINGIVTLIPNSVISSSIGLLIYIIMLYSAQKWIGKIKSNMQKEFELENREISACFLLILLLNGICLMALACINKKSLYCVMGIISLTLYVGFSVSLENLFDDKECSIKYGFNKKDAWILAKQVCSYEMKNPQKNLLELWPKEIMSRMLPEIYQILITS